MPRNTTRPRCLLDGCEMRVLEEGEGRAWQELFCTLHHAAEYAVWQIDQRLTIDEQVAKFSFDIAHQIRLQFTSVK